MALSRTKRVLILSSPEEFSLKFFAAGYVTKHGMKNVPVLERNRRKQDLSGELRVV
jgi:hypothetical protein